MAARRLITSQTLWDATAESWPSFTNSQIVTLENDDTLADGAATAWNSVSPSQAQVLGPILVPADAVYVDLEFFGTIGGVTTSGASGTGGDIFIVPYALPFSLHADDITHPIEDVDTYPNTGNARQGYVSDGIAVYGHDRSSPQQSHNEGTQVGLGNFPFAGNTMADGDAFHMIFSLGRMGLSGSASAIGSGPEISGYKKIWIRMGIQNSSAMGTDPSAFEITGKLVANLYEGS